MKTMYVLWQRQVKKYFRSRSRIIGSLAQPTLYLLSFGFGFGSIYQRAGEGNYIQFLAPGVILMSVLFSAIFSGIELIWDRQFGFLKETMVAPVPRFHIMLGRTLGGATVATLQGSVVFILTLFFGFKPYSWALVLPALLIVFLVAVFFTAVGTAIASLLEDMQGFQLIMNFLVMPVFFLSGALFPLQGLPPAIAAVTRIDPLTYGVDGVRGALINQAHFSVVSDLFVIFILAILMVSVGSYLFEKIKM